MRNLYSGIAMMLLLSSSAQACDVCSQYFGILPMDRFHQLNLSYMYTRLSGYRNIPAATQSAQPVHQSHSLFKTFHDPRLHNPTQGEAVDPYSLDDFEVYHTFTLEGKFWLSNRLQVSASLPFRQTRSYIGGQYAVRTGISDARAGIMYFPVWKDSDTLGIQLGVGGEAQLPTSPFESEEIKANALLQPGMQSWGAIFNTVGRIRYNRWGALAQAQYRITPENRHGVEFLNAFNGQFQVFRQLGKQNQWMPTVGLYYENTSGALYNGYWLEGTGGQVLSMQYGMSLYQNRWAINAMVQSPLWQDLLGTQLGQGGRIMLGISYFLPKG